MMTPRFKIGDIVFSINHSIFASRVADVRASATLVEYRLVAESKTWFEERRFFKSPEELKDSIAICIPKEFEKELNKNRS